MSTPPVFGPCNEYNKDCIGYTQEVLFFTALPLIAVGMAGHLVSLPSFLERQTKSENEEEAEAEAKQGYKIFLQIRGLVMLNVVMIAGGVALPYIKPWAIRFAIPAICALVATLLFLSGHLEYKHRKLEGSPLTATLRVFVATARKISRPNPKHEELYNDDDTRSTSSLRCLDKAAIMLPEQQQTKNWALCSVHEVEDTKIVIHMIPMWLTFIMIGLVLSIEKTYFLEQANHMDRKLGKIYITIPTFLLFYMWGSCISSYFYSFLTKHLPNKKYVPPLGIAISMIVSVLCCIIAAIVETRRLHVIRDHGLQDKPNEKIPMSIFYLLPQFMLLAAVDGIANTSITEFFKNQGSVSMQKYSGYFTKGVLGLGTMASVLSVYAVEKVSERNQKTNWFQATLNKSRLDRYYWTLAALSAANLVIYVIVAYFYKYKKSLNENVEVEVGELKQDFKDNAHCCCFCCC